MIELATAPRRGAAARPTAVVSIHYATAPAIEALPVSAATMAARIIADRQKNGAFKEIEELREAGA